jgi:hypothetical protein
MSNATDTLCTDTSDTSLNATIFTITTGLSTVLFLLSEILASLKKIEANSVFQLLYHMVIKKPVPKIVFEEEHQENENIENQKNNNNNKAEVVLAGAHKSLKVLNLDRCFNKIDKNDNKFFAFISLFENLESLSMRNCRSGFASKIADFLPSSLTHLSLAQIAEVDNAELFVQRLTQQCPQLQHLHLRNGLKC